MRPTTLPRHQPMRKWRPCCRTELFRSTARPFSRWAVRTGPFLSAIRISSSSAATGRRFTAFSWCAMLTRRSARRSSPSISASCKTEMYAKATRRSMLFRPDTQREALAKILAGGQTVAWYQPGVGVTGTLNASLWANWVNGTAGTAADLAQATGANQLIVLPWTGANYAYLPAVAGNTLTSPNQTVTGNQTITFDVALNDYTPAADVTLFSKTSGNDGFSVLWLTTDKIRLVIGDGVGLTNVDVVAASGFADFSRHTVIIAWEDGVGATFSYDGVVSGSQVAAAKTLTNAAAVMTIGSTTSIGKVYRMQAGSLYDLNAALAVETSTNGATFVGGAGETWTLNNTGATPAQIVVAGQPSVMGNQAN